MYGGKASRVSGVEKLQEIEGLASADFPEDNPIGPVSKRCFEEISNGDCRQAVLRLPRFETDKIVLTHVNFRGVLDEQNTLIPRDESPEDIE